MNNYACEAFLMDKATKWLQHTKVGQCTPQKCSNANKRIYCFGLWQWDQNLRWCIQFSHPSLPNTNMILQYNRFFDACNSTKCDMHRMP